MLQRILSFLLSLAVGFGSTGFAALPDMRDLVSVMVFGLPVTGNAVNDDCVNYIDPGSVISLGKSLGIVKDKIILIIDPETGFFKKREIFISEGLTAVGWCTLADMYIASAPFAGASDIIAECERLERRSEILAAVPLVASEISPDYTPDDPFDPDETLTWDEINAGGSNWWLEAVRARQAWDYSPWYSLTKVGVVDNGIEYGHEDFSGNIHTVGKRQEKRNRPDSHGTHVAGIIAANANNSKGISGILPGTEIVNFDWDPDDDQYWSTSAALLFDLIYAVRDGAKVINYSVGKSSSIDAEENTLPVFDMKADGILYSYVMAALLDRGYDFLVVQSAGNGNEDSKPIDGRNGGLFAAVFGGTTFTGLHKAKAGDIMNHIILAGAAKRTYSGYAQTYFSNGGPEVELFAPGNYVYSTVDGNSYGYKSGTSMAAPVITAVAAMTWGVNPSLTGAEVKNIVVSACDTAVKALPADDYYGRSENTDKPLVNAKLAVEKALTLTYGELTRVSGTDVRAANGKAVYDSREYTVLPDGSYDFLTFDGGKGEVALYNEAGELITDEPDIPDNPDNPDNPDTPVNPGGDEPAGGENGNN